MDKFAGKYSPYFFAILRIVAGLLFAMHGSQKLLGWPGDNPAVEIVSQMGLAGIIELVGGLMILLGFFAQPASFIASGEMAFAYFMVHAPQGLWPIMNKGELAVLYCFLFLFIAAHGSGIWSLDAWRKTNSANSPGKK